MSPEATAELVAELRNRAAACLDLADQYARKDRDAERLRGKVAAYKHAAELVEATAARGRGHVGECACEMCREFMREREAR